MRDKSLNKEDGTKSVNKINNWNNVIAKFRKPPYKNYERKIFEKLDEKDHYAILHHSVLSNNLWVCQELIEKYQCSKHRFNFFLSLFIDCFVLFFFIDINLIGNDGQTLLHLAASSIEIEEDTKKAANDPQKVCDTCNLSKYIYFLLFFFSQKNQFYTIYWIVLILIFIIKIIKNEQQYIMLLCEVVLKMLKH